MLGLLGVLAAGCGGGSVQEPRSLPPVTTVPSPSASPSPSGVVTAAEIDAAARAVFAALNEAMATTDPAPYVAVAVTQCPCVAPVTKGLRAARAAGHTFTGKVTVLEVTPHDLGPTGGQAKVHWMQPASAELDSAGGVVRKLPAVDYTQDLFLVRDNGTLKVFQIVGLG
ncbi:MAG: hypothetical protein LC789_03940 [Actinobacteria bacterium]|nr:hypothetical protein [Actinomycetota bacterium]MCA1719629.1 hypothetical protein [Actinomycetota bacterium]